MHLGVFVCVCVCVCVWRRPLATYRACTGPRGSPRLPQVRNYTLWQEVRVTNTFTIGASHEPEDW